MTASRGGLPSDSHCEPDHRVILASAGTGKTYQLTNRLIGLLARGARPAEIVATTFTRKAAGEIMERVVERLCNAATNADQCDALSNAIGHPLTREHCIKLLRTIADSLDRFGILTIDSFFQRLAAVLSVEIGSGPDRRIMDDAEDAGLRAEALANAVELAPDGEIGAIVRLLYDGQPSSGILRRLNSVIDQGLTLLRETRQEPELWGGGDAGGDQPEHPEPSPDELECIADAILRAPLPQNKDGSNPKRWVSLQKDCAAWVRAGQLDTFVARTAAYVAAGVYDKKAFPDSTHAAFRAALEVSVATLVRRLAAQTRASRSLLERFEREYESLKARRGVWRFEDVPRAVLQHLGSERMDDAYFRLDGRVRHLLLDEFQDTSMLSFRLLEPLIDEIVAAEPPERTLFCVGDIKQSLYAWNGASPELLPAIVERWPQINRSDLSVSRRSSRAVLDVVNQVFGDLSSNIGLAGNNDLADRWNTHWREHQAHDPSLPGEATLLVPATGESPGPRGEFDSTTEESESGEEGASIAESEVSLAVERVATRRTQSPTASIAILVRANKSIAPVIHALGQAGIEASEEGAGSLLDAAPCAVIRSLLHLADHPSDTAARYHVACSPLGPCIGLGPGASDRETTRVAARIRSDVETTGMARTLDRLIEATSEAMSPREHARCLSLVQIARRLDAEGRAGCGAMVDAIDDSRVRETSTTRVRVMTTHAAKGLEFDVVILTDLGSSMFRRSAEIIGDRRDALGEISSVTCRPSPALQEAAPELGAIVDRAKNRVLMEGLCVLYVAMTRARHVLDIIISGRSLKIPRDGSTTIYPGRLIAGALTADQMPIEAAGILFQATLGDWAKHVQRRDTDQTSPLPTAECTEVTLRFARPSVKPSGRLARVSPSSLEGGGTRTLSEFFRPVSESGRSRGTLLHALFERIEWIEGGTPSDDELMAVLESLGSTSEQSQEAFAAFRAAAARPEIARWLSRETFPVAPGESLELWRERAFATRIQADAEPMLLSGRFDRVVIRKDGKGSPVEATLLDFKTDAVSDEISTLERARHYEPQLRAYRDALVASTGLPARAIHCILLFTEPGRTVRSSF